MHEVFGTMSPSVLILLANGFEEIEATAPIDLLRRAGARVTTVSCSGSLEITGRSDITIRADSLLTELENTASFHLLVLPGGPAVFSLRKRQEIIDIIRNFSASGQPIGAICAAPLLLLDSGLISPETICTGHESVRDEIPQLSDSRAVVQDGQIITSRGAGTAVEFGLALIHRLFGEEKEQEIRSSIHADLSVSI